MSDLIARLRADQLRRWQEGDRVRVEAYLESHPELRSRDDELLDLIYSEVLLRQESGDVVRPDEYTERFPQLGDRLRRLLAVHDLVDGSWAETPPRTGSPAPGGPAPATVAGYRIEAELGRGGRGVVYKARQLALDRVVALKMLRRDDDLSDPAELERFRREARAVAALRHPNIVQIYEFAEAEGRPYLAMEFVEGGSLADRLGNGPLPPREAAELVETLAGALAAVHRQQIVHRDLKPANVLLTRDGVPKVADFGLAKRLEGVASLTERGAIVGTPSYMAPEQAKGSSKDVGPAADVYALGAILFECLTGKPPFEGEHALDILLKVVSQPAPAPSAFRPVPAEIDSICKRCLQKEPSRRPPSAAALRDALAACRTAPRQERRLGAASRRLALLLGSAALLAVVAGEPDRRGTRLVGEIEPDPVPPAPEIPPVPLIGPGGVAVEPVRYVVGKNEAPQQPGGEFLVRTSDLCITELVGSPPEGGYRVEAQVRHVANAGAAEVGLYFGHSAEVRGAGTYHGMLRLTFSDVGDDSGRVKVSCDGIVVGPQKRLPGNTILCGPSKRFRDVPAPAPGSWRALAVEVDGDGARVFWEGEEFGTLARSRLPQLSRTLFPAAGVAPQFLAGHSLGLFVLRATAGFRSVVLKPKASP